MMQDKIHDALNFIDDDMIEAVEGLRAVKAESKKSVTMLRTVMFFAASAACLMIVAVAAILATGPLRSIGEVYSGETTTCGAPTAGNTAAGAGSSTLLVRITAISDDGFTAIALDDYVTEETIDNRDIHGSNIAGAGNKYLYVVYSEAMKLVENPELSVGSVVKVEYSEIQENKVMADKIMPEDSEED